MNHIISDSKSGLELYHAIWKLVGETFFDVSRLADWNSWEQRFNKFIASEEDALFYADQMLASLKDPYTERLIPVQTSGETAISAPLASISPSPAQGVLRPDGIGYIRISSFDDGNITEQVQDAVLKVANCIGVILDLRQNSGGRMHQALDCCGFFLTEGLLTTIESREADGIKSRQYAVTADSFFATEIMPDGRKVDGGDYPRRPPLLAGKPIVIIINGRTASAGELMVGAIAENGEDGKLCIIGGEDTPGKGIGQADYDVLDGKAKIRITRCRWLPPSGEWLGDCGQTLKNGITPTIFVENINSLEAFKTAILNIRMMLEQSIAA